MNYAVDGHWSCSRCQSFGSIRPSEVPHCECDEVEENLRADLAAAERERDEARDIARVAEREAIEHRDALSNARHLLALVGEWTHVHGKALCPRGADTYGEGMRDAKEQVGRILAMEGS